MTTESRLDPFHAALLAGGYTVQEIEREATGNALVAETPYALVLCFEAEWEQLEDRVEQVQAELTNMAAEHPSPRSWDLYVVVVLQQVDRRFDAVREAIENDIRYARKIVVPLTDGTRAEAERALRPLLPLKPITELPLIDPLQAVRRELLELKVDAQLVEAAVRGFEHNSEVRVP